MKIVEIKEPREGFVYRSDMGDLLVHQYEYGPPVGLWLANSLDKPIGKLGITHRIEDGKLVEIERREIEVGDVFENYEWRIIITFASMHGEDFSYMEDNGETGDTCKKDITRWEMQKSGTMGVTHEIDWRIE